MLYYTFRKGQQMILISLNKDQQNIASRFRKADYFALIEDKHTQIVKNLHKTSKSDDFFEYFNQLGITTIYIKQLGYKTYIKLEALNIKVYFIQGVEEYKKIKNSNLLLINKSNAKELCSLGHHKKIN